MMMMMMINMLLIKFIYMLRIQMEQTIDILLKNVKKLALNTIEIQKLSVKIELLAGSL